jgi:hypothetical protein
VIFDRIGRDRLENVGDVDARFFRNAGGETVGLAHDAGHFLVASGFIT